MESIDIQRILQKTFVFYKQLPTHLYHNPKITHTFLVSPLSANTKKSLDLEVPFDTFVHSFKNGIYTLEDSNADIRIQLRDAGSNQSFAYFMLHAYLGGILGAALKNMDEGLVLKEDGLYLTKDYPLKENHAQTIHTQLVTDNFEEILHLFELSPITIINGFKNKREYFQYLCMSPYINMTTLKRLENSDCDFLADFYKAVKKYSWSLYDSRELPGIESSEKYFKNFTYQHYLNKYNQKLNYFMNVTVKSDPVALISLLKKDFPDADTKLFGKMMIHFKREFKSKGEYKDFLFASTHEDIVKRLKDIAFQKCIL